jgi:hypothetical protein
MSAKVTYKLVGVWEHGAVKSSRPRNVPVTFTAQGKRGSVRSARLTSVPCQYPMEKGEPHIPRLGRVGGVGSVAFRMQHFKCVQTAGRKASGHLVCQTGSGRKGGRMGEAIKIEASDTQ